MATSPEVQQILERIVGSLGPTQVGINGPIVKAPVPIQPPETSLQGFINQLPVVPKISTAPPLSGLSTTSGSGPTFSDPKLARLYAQNQRVIANLHALGSTPAKSHHFLGINWGGLVDVLSRPEYAVADAFKQLYRSTYNHESVGQNAQRFAGGLLHGISGTHKTLISDVTQEYRDEQHAISRAKVDAYNNNPSVKSAIDDVLKKQGKTTAPSSSDITHAWDLLTQLGDKLGMGQDRAALSGVNTHPAITPGEGGANLINKIIGTAGNIVIDPLNFVAPLKVVKTLSKASKAAIDTGKAAADLTPVANQIEKLGVKIPSEPLPLTSKRVVDLLAPKLPSYNPQNTTTVVRKLSEIGDAVHGRLQQVHYQTIADELKNAGTPILKNSELPAIKFIPDLSNEADIAKGFKAYMAKVDSLELRRGKALETQYPLGFKNERAFRDAYRKVKDNPEEAKKFLINPKTGKAFSDQGIHSASGVYREYFKLLNHGAANETEALANQAKLTKRLRSNDPKIVSARRKAIAAADEAALERTHATALHEVAAPLKLVKNVKAAVGRDMAKLAEVVPVGSVNGPYTAHIGTLDKALKRAQINAGRELTDVEKEAITSNWWDRMHEQYARVMEQVANPNFQTDRRLYMNAAIAGAKARWSSLHGAEQVAAIRRSIRFSGAEYDAVMNVRNRIKEELRAVNKEPRRKLTALKQSRALAEAEPTPDHQHFFPHKADATEYQEARIANDARKIQAHQLASKRASEDFQAIHDSMESAVHTAYAPDFIKRFAFQVHLPGHTINLMTSPEILSRWMRYYVTGDGLIGDSVRGWKHAFVSTGDMSPEIASIKLGTQGQLHQLIRYNLNRLNKEFGKVPAKTLKNVFDSTIRGLPVSDPMVSGLIDKHLDEVVNTLLDPENIAYGVSPRQVIGYLTDKYAVMIPAMNKAEKEIRLGTFSGLRTTFRQAILRGIETGKINDPLEFINDLHIAKNNVIFGAKLKKVFADTFGVSTVDGVNGTKSKAVQELINSGKYRYLKTKVNGVRIYEAHALKNYVFDTKIADDIERTFELLHDRRSIEEFSKFIDKAIHPWRAAVTVYNLGPYQGRNALQNAFMVWYAMKQIGSDTASMSRSYQLAFNMIKHRNPELYGALNPVEAALHATSQTKGFFRNRGADSFMANANRNGNKFKDVSGSFITYDTMLAHFLKNGGDTGFISNQFGRVGKITHKIANKGPTIAGHGINFHNVNRAIVNATQESENYFRHTLFIDAIRNSSKNTLDEAAAEAMQVVRKYLFDYHDLTAFEKSSLLRVFPFYKWTRKALPVLTEVMFAQPGKIINVEFGMRGVSNAMNGQFDNNDPWKSVTDTIVPDWMRDQGLMPIGGKNYGALPLPFEGVAQTVTNPNEVAGMINPILRVPIEEMRKHQFYHDLPIKDRTKYATLGQFPQSNKIASLLASIDSGQQAEAPGGASAGGGSSSNVIENILKNLGLLKVSKDSTSAQMSQLKKELQQNQGKRAAILGKLRANGG